MERAYFAKRTVIGMMTASLLLAGIPATAMAKDNGNGNGNGNGKGEDNLGTGQSQVHIHLDGSIGNNKDDITITVGDNSYQGNIHGNTLEVEIGNSDNGFDFGADESLDIGYTNNTSGTSGSINITHQEGNGTNIGKEHDEGKNNYKGNVNQPAIDPPADPVDPVEPPAEPVNPPAPPAPPVVIEEPQIPEAPQPRMMMFRRAPEVIAVELRDIDDGNDDDLLTIADEEVPLADVPATGDASLLWALISGMSAGGMVLINKKREDEA